MKILILTGIFPPDIGGPATQLDHLAQALIKKDFEIQVLTFGQPNNDHYLYPVKRVSSQWPYLIRFCFFNLSALRLAKWADIIYAQDLYTAGLTGWMVKKIRHKPLVSRFVGDSAWETATAKKGIKDDIMSFEEKKYDWLTEWRKKIRKMILVSSDQVIVVSHFLKNLALKIGVPTDKIKVIYNSVDFLSLPLPEAKQALKKKLGLQGYVMLTIARLTPWKGVDKLIELMPDLIKEKPDLKFVILGSGSEMPKLKKIVRFLNLEPQVYFMGKADRQATMEYLSAADLFVLNTNYEGMSHCLLEAMKAGLPVITTNVGGNPETILDRQTGLIVEYNHQVQWTEAVKSLIYNPALANQLAKAAQNDLKRFSWANLVQQTVTVFQSLKNV